MPLMVLNSPESDDLPAVVDDDASSTGAPLVAGLGSIAAIVRSRETCGGGKADHSYQTETVQSTPRLL